MGRICCVVGLLFGAGGIVFSISSASVNLSAGALGIVLGLIGYFLGIRRLAAAIVVGVIAPISVAAASTGLILGVAPPGHGYE